MPIYEYQCENCKEIFEKNAHKLSKKIHAS